MIDSILLYVWVQVLLTLTFIQGHRSARKQKNFCTNYLKKFSVWMEFGILLRLVGVMDLRPILSCPLSTKTECDYLNGLIKKKKNSRIRKNLIQKWLTPEIYHLLIKGENRTHVIFVLKNKQTNKQTKNALTCAGIQTFTDWCLSNLIWWERWLSSTFLTNLSIDMDEIHYVATTIGLW